MKLIHVLLVLIYVFLIWVISGMARTAGMFVCLAGLSAFACCVLALRLGFKRPIFVIYLAAINLALFVGIGELALRIAPQLLGGRVANIAYSGYHCSVGGIYERDARLGFTLRPSTSATLYWNGHWWRHHTNAAGYRGELVERADVVFLGDSMIYGHGVDDADTAPSQFARLHSCRVANLGQQGMCLVQMYARFRSAGATLRPAKVFACCHPNDISECTYWYPEEELQRFVDRENYEPLARREFWPRPWWRADQHVWNAHLAPGLRFAGAVDAAIRVLASPSSPVLPVESPSRVPPAEKIIEAFAPWRSDSPRERLGWRVHCEAVRRLKEMCATHDAELVLFDIGYPEAFSQAIENLAKEMKITYSSAGRTALAQAFQGEDVYLINDGHWSAHGCSVIARALGR